MTEFSKINFKHQTTDWGSSEKTKNDKCQKILHLGISYSNCRNKNKFKKSQREPAEKTSSRKARIRNTLDFSSKPCMWGEKSEICSVEQKLISVNPCIQWNYPSSVKDKYFLR